MLTNKKVKENTKHVINATVVEAKMQGTCRVVVATKAPDKKYKKYVTKRTNLLAHDELGCKPGDEVMIQSTRPISRNKSWKIVELIKQS